MESQSLLTQAAAENIAPIELEVTSEDTEDCSVVSWDHNYVLPNTQAAAAKKEVKPGKDNSADIGKEQIVVNQHVILGGPSVHNTTSQSISPATVLTSKISKAEFFHSAIHDQMSKDLPLIFKPAIQPKQAIIITLKPQFPRRFNITIRQV